MERLHRLITAHPHPLSGVVTVSSLLITHERLARWARQLRPRLAPLPIELVETRSRNDLLQALARHPAPLLLVDLEHRPEDRLGDLEAALAASPETLAIVIDSQRRPGVPVLCRELGATEVFSGPVPPPVIAERLTRWHALHVERLPGDGWTRLQALPHSDPDGLGLTLPHPPRTL